MGEGNRRNEESDEKPKREKIPAKRDNKTKPDSMRREGECFPDLANKFSGFNISFAGRPGIHALIKRKATQVECMTDRQV